MSDEQPPKLYPIPPSGVYKAHNDATFAAMRDRMFREIYTPNPLLEHLLNGTPYPHTPPAPLTRRQKVRIWIDRQVYPLRKAWWRVRDAWLVLIGRREL
jgi:hypothetical protein